ncbi:methylmalonyl-CoA mutase family protein [Phenylobacterium soli]|uniref:Methylmalonyl-CoA mutase n=1 Tax=Phenylobacterium soli TaxID=2170551 RepID=A0A328ASJ0_9CAUL|nr:methylmalonyl-CoA mutase family protein [Phenylobacterium soli]RAK55888.1 methylmalonyl-CoA mutase [Phenylobacterium soli]
MAEALTSPFPPASEEAWRALVEKTLKDAPFESLRKTTVEGLPIEPLYEAASGPARFPTRPFDAERAWDLRVLTAHPDAVAANAEILRDLEGGAASVVVRIDPTGQSGVAVGSADGLAQVLKGVVPEFATLGLDGGFLGPKAADWLGAFAKASPGALLAFNLDPLSAFAETGVSPGPVESHLVSAATVAVRLGETYPKAQLFMASGRVVHEAGGGEAAEVAFAAASALAYAKALVRAGMPVAEAFKRITLGLSADADYFATIAKLRAARLVWARIASACGAEPLAHIEARSSRRMLAAKDAWTNMIRLTAAGFGAAVGGADAIVLGAFTDALGLPTAFGRRQSRNTQLVLMEEAHVGRVADPAAGSGYIETLSEEIARAAWAAFQAIEAKGGIIAALSAGLVAETVAKANAARGPLKIVGVTAFPPEKETPVEVETAQAKPVEAPSPRLPGPDGACPPLKPIRLSQAHEAVQ